MAEIWAANYLASPVRDAEAKVAPADSLPRLLAGLAAEGALGASREPVVARYDSIVPETFMSEHVMKPNPFEGWTTEEREAHMEDRVKQNADAKAQSPEGIAQARAAAASAAAARAAQKQITQDRQEEEDILAEARGIAEAGYDERMAYIMAGSPDAAGKPRETDAAIMAEKAEKFSTEHHPELLDRDKLVYTMDEIRHKRQLAAKKATKASKLGGSPKKKSSNPKRG